MTDNQKPRLAKSSYSLNLTPYGNTYPLYLLPGLAAPDSKNLTYHDIIQRTRFFYENDTIAGTVLDRMSDIASTGIQNRHRKYATQIKDYYDGIARMLSTLLRPVITTYLIDGMAIADYRTDRIMGNRLHQNLGRTRYIIPKAVWVRDNANIILKKGFSGNRVVYIKIPDEDVTLIRDQGKPDREQEYQDLVDLYPEYVAAVQKGARMFRIDCVPIMRKLVPYNTYPIPFLKRTLGALEYRRALKRMDKITSDRVIAAIRQISVGSDEYPADDDDITATKNVIQQQTTGSTADQDSLLNVYTNHTIKIQWIVPPIDNILSSEKYVEANADCFLGMGFPRLWTVGENERSNSADNTIAAVGPIAMINTMRDDILDWVRWLYADLADKNGFTQYPDPYWSPINIVAMQDLLQYAAGFLEAKTLSRDTVAKMYGSSFTQEYEQRMYEEEIDPTPTPQQNTTVQEVTNDNNTQDQNTTERMG